MRAGPLALATVLALALPAVAAGSGNPTNDRLLALSPEQQAQALAQHLGHGCVGVSAFPMGVTAKGKAKGLAYWSVGCKDGRSFAIQIAPDKKGSSIAADCRALQGTGHECFKKF
jgi:hypothetical protein